MSFDEVLQLYLKKNSSSVMSYKSIVRNYIEFMGKTLAIDNNLTSERTKDFIMKEGDNKIGQKYSAVRNFYNFYYDEIHKSNPSKKLPFPIEKRDLPKERTGKKKKKQTTFLSKEFDLSELLNDKYYSHLKNENVALMCKAAIGLAIATGANGGYIVPSDKKDTATLEINDVIFEDDKCIVPNVYKEGTFIHIDGKIKDILYKYYEIRKNTHVTKSGQENHFIAELDKHARFEHDDSIDDKKPYGRHPIVSYMLKYICVKNAEEIITLDHIRYNMIYHSLIQSKGTSFNEIIELFGMKEPHVIEALNHYHNEMFVSDISKPVYVINSEDFIEKKTSKNDKTLLYIQQRLRDKKKVRFLKELYDYKCQVCNQQITLMESVKYCEVHHIRPLGSDHSGPDETYNMIVVCPNHHVLFDLGLIALNPSRHNQLLHADFKNPLNQKEIILKHKLDTQSLRYTYANILVK